MTEQQRKAEQAMYWYEWCRLDNECPMSVRFEYHNLQRRVLETAVCRLKERRGL